MRDRVRKQEERTTLITPPLTLPLASADPPIELVGGKGRALARLVEAGLPVPAGFTVTTRAYLDFVARNQLEAQILSLASAVDVDQPETADAAAASIHALFESGLPVDATTVAALAEACAGLGDRPVAVRSSATAEDLPSLSFAGLHDSFLNVKGEDAVLAALRGCWASLWTARAIVYRTRMGIDHARVAMGVIVQTMVDADTAGVCFTANPATGNRGELVINSSSGLGDALVGGELTPESRLLDRSALPDEPIGELARLCLATEALFDGTPQDVEWVRAGNQYWLLQARPVTGLPEPLPDAPWAAPYPGARLVRRQVVENMPEPLSPLFEELYLTEGLDHGLRQMTANMGLPIRMQDVIRLPLFVAVNGYGYCRYEFRLSWRVLGVVPRVLYWYVAVMPGFFRQLIVRWRDQGLAAYEAIVARWREVEPTTATDEQLLEGVRALAEADAGYWYYITMMVGAAKLTEGLLARCLGGWARHRGLTTAMFLRGFTSQSQAAEGNLARIAGEISGSPALRSLVSGCSTRELLTTLAADPDGQAVAAELQAHLERFGHQVYNLDFVEPTQIEEPAPVLVALKFMASREDPLTEWSTRQEALVEARESLERYALAAMSRPRGWLVKKVLPLAQRYCPYREEALFYMGAAWPTLRRLAAQLGQRLVGAGILGAADEVYFLHGAELEQACQDRAEGRTRPDLGDRARERITLRQARKRLHPPARVPEDVRFKLGPLDFTRVFEVWESQKRNVADTAVLNGFAVSPGRVTGIASVVLTPSQFDQMAPGTILVCPTTTPAWTPLFGQASGLVTDIGAVLAHGSIVAREYGIPAVLGTGNGTQRIVSGQRITVDGTAGTVTII